MDLAIDQLNIGHRLYMANFSLSDFKILNTDLAMTYEKKQY